jgi:hypothetical protein
MSMGVLPCASIVADAGTLSACKLARCGFGSARSTHGSCFEQSSASANRRAKRLRRERKAEAEIGVR